METSHWGHVKYLPRSVLRLYSHHHHHPPPPSLILHPSFMIWSTSNSDDITWSVFLKYPNGRHEIWSKDSRVTHLSVALMNWFLFFWHLLSYVGAAMFPRWTHINLALSSNNLLHPSSFILHPSPSPPSSVLNVFCILFFFWMANEEI